MKQNSYKWYIRRINKIRYMRKNDGTTKDETNAVYYWYFFESHFRINRISFC